MMNNDSNKEFVNSLLNKAFKPKDTLEDLFNKRLKDLDISEAAALKVMDMQSRTLKGIINGTTKQVDFISLIKLSNFLQIPRNTAIDLYADLLEKNFAIESPLSDKEIKFIKENFDLTALQKAGFINSISDFKQIDDKLKAFFGIKSILEYERPKIGLAYSAGVVVPKNDLSRSMVMRTAIDLFEEIENPYPYNRELLINFFPQIRWHSMNVELGLKNVIAELYKYGITVIYLPPFSSLHLRGAMFPVNDKPCIVLTDISGFYPTLWFALIHEIFHVIFDWDEIKEKQYHVSDKDILQLVEMENEVEADNFAREYLFSKEKLLHIKPFMRIPQRVKDFADNNHVHESFVYVFNAFDSKKPSDWVKAKAISPKTEDCVHPFINSWENLLPPAEYAKLLKNNIYN